MLFNLLLDIRTKFEFFFQKINPLMFKTLIKVQNFLFFFYKLVNLNMRGECN